MNPGNSGGGLYDKSGTLIGINTWTNDKRSSEGLGFAIALDSLLELDPPGVHAAHAEPAKTKEISAGQNGDKVHADRSSSDETPP